MITKLLIANRGEIAVRVIRTAQEMNIQTVAVYAANEKESMHVQMADEAFCLSGNTLAETYLNVNKIIGIALQSHCQAIHPGYGFLSESPALVKSCEDNNIIFIGPDSKAIELMGNKVAARKFAQETGVPLVQGMVGSQEEIMAGKDKLKYPVLVKAAAGGGGKGMRIVRNPENLHEALTATSREALSYFNDETVFVEQYLESPRHIEVQVLGDQHGQVIHLFERECSIQRRYQKIIEEAPSPTLDDKTRKNICQAAVDLTSAISYTSAGTIEFLLDDQMNFYFLEMNTRIQVEHPVTEMTTHVDIVREQIRIAEGKPLEIKQENLQQNGHAIECRIYAENPEQNFLPSPGDITFYRPPVAQNLRLDTAIIRPTRVESQYDPMIGKLIAWAPDRSQAIERITKALKQYPIHGIDTNISFLIHFLGLTDFKNNQISTHYCDHNLSAILNQMKEEKQHLDVKPLLVGSMLFPFSKENDESVWNEIGFWRLDPSVTVLVDDKPYELEWRKVSKNQYSLKYEEAIYDIEDQSKDIGERTFSIDDQLYQCFLSENENGSLNITYEGYSFVAKRNDILGKESYLSGDNISEITDNQLVSPMPGKIIKLMTKPGDEVKRGTVLLIVEAMKMENNITAPSDGIVKEVYVSEQEMVERNKPLILME